MGTVCVWPSPPSSDPLLAARGHQILKGDTLWAAANIAGVRALTPADLAAAPGWWDVRGGIIMHAGVGIGIGICMGIGIGVGIGICTSTGIDIDIGIGTGIGICIGIGICL